MKKEYYANKLKDYRRISLKLDNVLQELKNDTNNFTILDIKNFTQMNSEDYCLLKRYIKIHYDTELSLFEELPLIFPAYVSNCESLLKHLDDFIKNKKNLKRAKTTKDISFYLSGDYQTKKIFKKGTLITFAYHQENSKLFVFYFSGLYKFGLTEDEFEWN